MKNARSGASPAYKLQVSSPACAALRNMAALVLRGPAWKTFAFRGLAAFIVLAVMLPRAWAGDSCSAKQVALKTFLNAQPNHCAQDADCDGYYLSVDACAPPVAMAKPGVIKAQEPQLLKLQDEVREACADFWNQRPECSPISFQAKCRENRCVNAAPAAKAEYPFTAIRHECGPWDGPAIGIHLTQSEAREHDIPAPSLNISVWRGLPPPTDQPISLLAGGVGTATRCLSPEKCETATSATINFTNYDDNSVSGSYALKFKKGDIERGSFQADWQDYHDCVGEAATN
ncbi:MAG TPA: hypothetical protein VK699_20295 [Terriglobales bacterium]|jgi:hypothetical protein|nr:hypothetical protein [Terriglobales bacterium]